MMTSVDWQPMKKVLLILMPAILLIGLSLQALVLFMPHPEPTLQRPLADVLPRELPGWRVEDLPLGSTEELDRRSHNLLRLDDFVFRSFTRGERNFSIYVAYWEPGKMPVRLVNAHTPDRCWTWTGWRATDMRFAVRKNSPKGPLLPAEWRIFEKDGFSMEVYYWHLFGGEVHTYRQGFNELPPIWLIFHDVASYGINFRREQFFIRITSTHSIDLIWEDPGFQLVLKELASLGLLDRSQVTL